MADARDRYRGGDGGRADAWIDQDLGAWPLEDPKLQITQEIDAELTLASMRNSVPKPARSA